MGRPRSSDPTEAFPLRIRGSLLARIRAAAEARGVTPAAWIAEACEDSLDAVYAPPRPEDTLRRVPFGVEHRQFVGPFTKAMQANPGKRVSA